jgi:hypothetical protein
MSNINNRVSALEKKVERLRKYIVIRDGLWVREHLDELDDFIIPYDGVEDVSLRMQLEFDNLMMCRARLQEDFLEYCRRVGLQIEGLSAWALGKEDKREPSHLPNRWKIVQQNKSDRWRGSYDEDDYPGAVSNIRLMDSLELAYCVFTEGKYYHIDRDAKKEFQCLVNALRMRNLASHREEKSDPVRRMNSNERDFYEARESNYKNVCCNLKKFLKRIFKYFDKKESKII